MKKTARLIQVGLGVWGRNWASKMVPKVGLAETVAWVDGVSAVRELAIEELALDPKRCFSSLPDALNSYHADGVIGVVPLSAHADLVRCAIQAHKHVLIEKPFAPDTKLAHQLVAESADQGLICHVSQNYRFFPAPRKAAELIREGNLGRLWSVDVEFRRYAPEIGYRYYDLPNPILADMSIHHYDLLRMVLGREPNRVICRTWNVPGSPFKYDPCCAALMQFGDIPVTYRGNWMSQGEPTPWAGHWRLDFDMGHLRFTSRVDADMSAEADRVWIKKRGETEKKIVLETDHLLGRVGTTDAFCRAILGLPAPPFVAVAADNLQSIRLMEAMIQSAESDGSAIDL